MTQRRVQVPADIGMIWTNATWLGVIPILLNVVALFSTGFITRRVGAELFGRFSIALAIVSLTISLTDCGLRALAVRNLARAGRGAHRGLHDLVSLRLLTGSLAMLLAWLVAALCTRASGLAPVVMVASIGILPTALTGIFTDGLMARDQARATSAATFWSGILLTAASVIMVAIRPTAEMLAASYLVGPVVNVTMLSRQSRKHYGPVRLRWRPRQWRVLIARSWPFFKVAIVSVAIGRVETPLIGWLLGTRVAGIYAAAISLAERLGAVIDSVATATLPTLMRMRGNAAEISDVLARILHPLLSALLVGGIMAMMGATAAVTVVFGAEYAPGGVALAVALLTLPVSAVNALMSEAFLALGRFNFVAATAQRGQLVVGLLLPTLTALLGLPGAPIARLGGGVAVLLVQLREGRKTLATIWEASRMRHLMHSVLWALPVPIVLWFGHFRPIAAVLFSGGAFLCWLAATAHSSGVLRMLRESAEHVPSPTEWLDPQSVTRSGPADRLPGAPPPGVRPP